jgi:hypothetical protein
MKGSGSTEGHDGGEGTTLARADGGGVLQETAYLSRQPFRKKLNFNHFPA